MALTSVKVTFITGGSESVIVEPRTQLPALAVKTYEPAVSVEIEPLNGAELKVITGEYPAGKTDVTTNVPFAAALQTGPPEEVSITMLGPARISKLVEVTTQPVASTKFAKYLPGGS
jgi:hypothetical protein